MRSETKSRSIHEGQKSDFDSPLHRRHNPLFQKLILVDFGLADFYAWLYLFRLESFNFIDDVLPLFVVGLFRSHVLLYKIQFFGLRAIDEHLLLLPSLVLLQIALGLYVEA